MLASSTRTGQKHLLSAVLIVVALLATACYPMVAPNAAYVTVVYDADEIIAQENQVYDRVVNDDGVDIDLLVNIYRPPGDQRRPTVILIHGGAFQIGDNTIHRSDAIEWARRGYVALTPTYRLNAVEPEDDPDNRRIVDATADIQVMMKRLKANAADYKVDSDRIAVLGLSAGGMIGLLLAQELNLSRARFNGPEDHLPNAVFTTGAAVTPLIEQGLIAPNTTATPVLVHHYQQDPVTGFDSDDANLICTIWNSGNSRPACKAEIAEGVDHYISIGPDGERSFDLIMPFLASELRLATAATP